ncbi:MAG: helix-turn-helix domain-containing protein [Defluviitaleaceae bacterium]|nr:helix-turn-helix domain-containing protein [Defluviitaleaceae bacterium]
MAKLLGCTEQHYQRFEYGKVTPNAIVIGKLADYFEVSTDYLLGRSDNPKLK